MIVSSRLLVPHKIDAKCGDRFPQADLNGTDPSALAWLWRIFLGDSVAILLLTF